MNLQHRSTVLDAAALRIATACAVGALACNPLAAQAAELSAFTGTIAGYSGDIAGGCTTAGPPPELAFLSGAAAGLQVLGGNAACGFAGGWTNPTSTGTTTPLTNSTSLAPTQLGTSPTAKSFDATADARAAYGTLSARAHGHYSGPVVSYYDNASAAAVAAATFSDTFTAAVPTTTTDLSTSGFVRYQFSIDGNQNAHGPATAFLNGSTLTNFNIQHDGGPIYTMLNASTRTDTLGDVRGAGAASGWTLGPGSVSGGTTFESGLFSIDFMKSWSFKAGLIVNVWGNADNDFYSTAKLVGIELFDSWSQPIEGYSILSASGVDYLAGAVPEPASAVLLGMGLLALVGGARARRALPARMEQRRLAAHDT